MDDDDEGGLAVRRTRRSNAGNRMAWALAELANQPDLQGGDDDLEFVNEQDEEDEFEEDFESTADEEEHAEYDEQAVVADEKRAHRAQRKKLLNARNLGTLPSIQSRPARKQRVLSKQGIDLASRHPARHSTRKSTIINSQELDTKLKDATERRITFSKQLKPSQDSYRSQAQLTKMALDMEESNVNSHRNYLATEEAKRTQATTIHRNRVIGARLRWVSKSERMKPHHFYTSQYFGFWNLNQSPVGLPSSTLHYYPTSWQFGTSNGDSDRTDRSTSKVFPSSSGPLGMGVGASAPSSGAQYVTEDLHHSSEFKADPKRNLQSVIQSKNVYPSFYRSNYFYPPWPQVTPNMDQTERAWKHTINYVLHQLSDEEISDNETNAKSKTKVRKSNRTRKGKQKSNIPWERHMTALFGDHTDWASSRVITRHRPPDTCPVTGRRSRYMDPRTGVPFANVAAYKTLSALLRHNFEWSRELGSYVGCNSPDD